MYLWSNLALAGRNILARYGLSSREGLRFYTPRGMEIRINPWWLRTPAVVAAVLVSLSIGMFYYEQWDTWLDTRNTLLRGYLADHGADLGSADVKSNDQRFLFGHIHTPLC